MNNTLTVSSNTQVFTGNIGIGVAAIDEREYIDEEGATKKGLTSGLWIYDRSSQEAGEQFFWIHIGQVINAYNHSIIVVDIRSKDKGEVELQVMPTQ